MKLEAVISDMDGVLCATVDYHYRSWQEVADDAGIPFDRHVNNQLRGLTRRRSLETIVGERELPEAQLQAMMAQKNRHYLELIADLGPDDALPGAARLLDEVVAACLKIAVVSGSRHVKPVLERLGLAQRVDVMVDGSMVARSKPAPDGFLYAATLLEVPPVACLVLEDAPAGIAAARAAGMAAVGVGPAVTEGEAQAVFATLASVHVEDLQAAWAAQKRAGQPRRVKGDGDAEFSEGRGSRRQISSGKD